MSLKRNVTGGMVYYTSPLFDRLGIKHGFFTRLGGVSKGPYKSLNVKRSGDAITAVHENRKRMCEAIGVAAARLVFANELGHSNRIAEVDSERSGQDIAGLDALISRTKGIAVALSVADCVPVLFVAQDRSVAGVIHVSWRSLNAGIIQNTLKNLRIQPSQLVAALGPCIAVESYEVQDDFIQTLQLRFQKFIKKNGNKHYFDLLLATVDELKQFGVVQIDIAGIDTYTNTNEFYSYRKEGLCGRFGAIVCL